MYFLSAQQHNNFLINRAYLILPANKELRRIPTKQPVNNKYIICQHIRDKKKCNYKGTEGCQFAHCEEEKEMWSWMSQNNGALHFIVLLLVALQYQRLYDCKLNVCLISAKLHH